MELMIFLCFILVYLETTPTQFFFNTKGQSCLVFEYSNFPNLFDILNTFEILFDKCILFQNTKSFIFLLPLYFNGQYFRILQIKLRF